MRPRKTDHHVIEQEEIARAVQRAVEAALAAVLQERKTKLIEPPGPPPPSEVEQRIAKAAADPTKPPRRERHGFRGTPPPADFDLAELADDQLLTEYDVAALTRMSTNTLAAWRKRERDHPLPYFMIRSGRAGSRVRYRAGDVRQFIASGYRPQPGRPRTKDTAPLPEIAPAKPSRRRRAARPPAQPRRLAPEAAEPSS